MSVRSVSCHPKVRPRTKKLVHGQQSQSKVNKVSPKSTRFVRSATLSKVVKVSPRTSNTMSARLVKSLHGQ